MRTVRIGLTKVELYDSIKELPITRNHEFQKLVLQDMGVGSDIDSVGSHFSNLHALLSAGKTKESLDEARNLHNNFFMMLSSISIKSYCFGVLVHSINGKEVTDFTREGIEKTLKKVSKINVGKVEDILLEVKKNLIQSFNPIFLIDSPILGILM